RVAELAAQSAAERLNGQTGIAHTRWATHGAPTERNAHPHISGDIAIVHNGIVENHEALRERLKRAGYTFASETDTEVVAHLIAESVALGPYRHYMQKEIHEQPGALANTLEILTAAASLQPGLFGAEAEPLLRAASSVHLVACGTSYHAALIGRYWLEDVAGIPTVAEIASEYRYRRSVADPNGLFITISQSGETADTLAAMNE